VLVARYCHGTVAGRTVTAGVRNGTRFAGLLEAVKYHSLA
jgi:hypothetical protein